jgi:Sugar phosphate isomerases/epimerases
MALKVGIQLYSVRNAMAVDPVKTIEAVVKLGYKYIEVANHHALEDFGVGFGVDAKEIVRLMSGMGAQVVSAHIYPFSEETYDKIMEYNIAIGNRNIVYPMEHFNGEADVLSKCDLFNRLGKRSRENGLNFLYHNHAHEFQTIKGRLVEDIIVENTDPQFVNLELDTFWAVRAGMDPIELIRKYGDRIKLIHQKDISKMITSPVNVYSVIPREQADGERDYRSVVQHEDFTEIGKGIMDIQKIIDTANEINSSSHIILEQDYTSYSDELESIKVSMDAFHKFKGISWE